MGKRTCIYIVLILFFAASCDDSMLIKDADYLLEVNRKFTERRELYTGREKELFSVVDQDITRKEKEALKFLLAYMPLSDIADYSGSFFLDNVKLSLRAIRETRWGNKIPEEIFLHYVLPVRVNNENLDSFRIAYYDEIHSRINSFDNITEASLEINHWCHEKVSYQPADIRTSAPMSTILSARGRCGEESTFTVAALRTAGIPARQIYTPRWAHSDDNHAWVEVWVDGKWKYLGACEPEPVLDRGWFTEPARRAMLTHTKAFGNYRGNENLVKMTDNYAEVNTLAKYARTKTLLIKVIDHNGDPVEYATVEPQLYNYAEFYPLTEIYTGADGYCSFQTGLGDLIVWGYKGDKFGFQKINVAETDTLIISLGDHSLIDDYYEFDLQPPVKHTPFPDTIPEKLILENARRLRVEDSIRQAYIDTWMTEDEAIELASKYSLDADKIKSIIGKSMGNYGEITHLFHEAADDYGGRMVEMLEQVSDKDLRDTRWEIIYDHLLCLDQHQNINIPLQIYNEYVLNPRISNEIITPWRSYILRYFDNEKVAEFKEDPYSIAEWIAGNITLTEAENYYHVPVSPEGVLKTTYADILSRNILFVAICRSLSIPAGLKEGIEIPRFYHDGTWSDVYFPGHHAERPSDASLSLSHTGGNPVPEYYRHFTIARFDNGRYGTINYDYNRKITSFCEDLVIPEGYYMIVTGNRTNDSKVLSSVSFFNMRGNEERSVIIDLRKDEKPPVILGSLSLDLKYVSGDNKKTLSETSENGLVIVWIEHDKEPSKHIMNDLPHVKKEMEELGCGIVVLSDPASTSASYNPDEFNGLPEQTVFGFDHNLDILISLYGEQFDKLQWPVVIYSDSGGDIYYMSDGYRIGIGEQILRSILNSK